MLGALEYTSDEKKRLGLIQVKAHDDYYQLCDYVNQKALSSILQGSDLSFPVLYINNENWHYYLFHCDEKTKYDNYGDPTYSGVYIQEPGKNGRIFHLDRGNLPQQIWEGVISIDRNNPGSFHVSGPQKQLFSYGKFIAES